jgi:hypothetical protein
MRRDHHNSVVSPPRCLGGATLAEVAQEFEHRTGQRFVFRDPALAAMRVGGRFRADDVEGFTNLLATTFEIDVERANDGTIVLRKKSGFAITEFEGCRVFLALPASRPAEILIHASRPTPGQPALPPAPGAHADLLSRHSFAASPGR